MGGSELGEVISQREAQAGAVEAFGDALSHQYGRINLNFATQSQELVLHATNGKAVAKGKVFTKYSGIKDEEAAVNSEFVIQ